MDYHGINMQGPFWIEEFSINSFSPEDEGKLRAYLGFLYYGSSTKWNKIGSEYSEIPKNATTLIYSNAVIAGWTLLGVYDDELIYITNGSDAGGETGGTAKSLGTWTQPVHSHPELIHSHGLGTHTHGFTGNTQIAYSTARCDAGRSGVGEWHNHSHPASFTTDPSINNTEPSSLNATGTESQSKEAGNPWRPLGRNFTVQKRT